MKKLKITMLAVLSTVAIASAQTDRAAYIYGDVARNGNIPSGGQPPYDQMLLTDTGSTGTSEFREVVQSEGYQIDQFYDQNTNLNANFLNQFDIVVFGLHQKIWSNSERNALHNWINNGGSIMVYSDSAAGGFFGQVDSANTVGQRAVNNIISRYGMQVTVDQADGVKARRSGSNNHPIVAGNLILEGEGVSPVAVDPNSGANILIPYTSNIVSGAADINRPQNITINNPQYAALAIQNVGDGHVVAMFDRQPMWNSGVGSNITERDNREILGNIIEFLARDSGSNIVTIRKRNSTGFSLDGGNGAASGQNVYLWNHNPNNVNQQWEEIDRGGGFYSYQKANTNFSLDGGNGGARAQNLYLWQTNANNFNQHWRKTHVTGNVYILQKRNSLGFSIDGGNGGARAQNVYLWSTSTNNQNMQWIIE